jgi:hypothetical protein
MLHCGGSGHGAIEPTVTVGMSLSNLGVMLTSAVVLMFQQSSLHRHTAVKPMSATVGVSLSNLGGMLTSAVMLMF